MSKERDSKQRIVFVQLFSEVSASEAVPSEIHVVPTGKWDHPVYGEMEITSADIAEFVKNFSRGVRRPVLHDDYGIRGKALDRCAHNSFFITGRNHNHAIRRGVAFFHHRQ